jgi:protoheme IX farnesyltransferase
MATSTVTSAKAIAARDDSIARLAVLRDYWTLTKPEVNFLIAIAAAAGFYLGSRSQVDALSSVRLFHTVLGTLLTAGGGAALNQYIERRFDARMRRTARRPLASGRLDGASASRFGLALSSSGVVYLAIATNALAAALGFVTLAIYLGMYTPLKRRTSLCTFIGAFSGAMPPVIGWAAASGQLSVAAALLYAVLFLWQFPHFMAIAWMHREDYDRAGYHVLPCGPRGERMMAWQALVPAAALIPLSVAAMIAMDARWLSVAAALILGTAFAASAVPLAVCKTNLAARRLLRASIAYLPALLLLMVAAAK